MRPSDLSNIRFGVLVNSDTVEAWQHKILSELLSAGAKAELVIHPEIQAFRANSRSSIFNYPFKKLLFRLYDRFLFKPSSKNRLSTEGLFKDSEHIYCQTSHQKWSEYFSKEDIDKIKSRKLHFILRFGFGIIRGGILESAEYGVWSYHHGDETKFRGGPPGFWEIYKKDKVTGVILQKLTEKLDGGIILEKAWFPTLNHSYSGQLDQLYFGASYMPERAIRNILNNGFKGYVSNTDAGILHPPGNIKMVKFMIRLFRNKLKFHWEELFRHEDWTVGSAQISYSELMEKGQLNASDIEWLPKPSNTQYLADPFFIDSNRIIAELYDYKKGKGRLSQIELTSNTRKDWGTEYHMSYPYTFEHQGTQYLVPESFEENNVSLYTISQENNAIEKLSVLLPGFKGIDPSLIFYHGLWWLFVNRKDQPNVHLYLYYSSQLEGPYIPHPLNPVKSDIRSSRPAGKLFLDKEKLIRPAQDSIPHYGAAVRIMEVTKLSEKDFEEKEILKLGAVKGTVFSRGLHTINFHKQFLLIDGKRYTFIPSQMRRNLAKKIKRISNV